MEEFLVRTIWNKIPTWTKLSALAILVIAAFVLRDDSILGSAVIVALVVLAAIAHLGRQEYFQNPANLSYPPPSPTQNISQGPIPSQPRSNPIKNILRGPIWLFIVEWLFLAAAAHYVTNDFNMPFERLTECISSGFECCRFSLWG